MRGAKAKEISGVVRRRVYLFLAVFLPTFLLPLVVYVLRAPKYRATSTIQYQKSSSNSSPLTDLISAGGEGSVDAFSTNVELQTQARILTSDSLAVSVIDRLHLVSDPDYELKEDPFWTLRKKIKLEPVSMPLEQTTYRRQQILALFEKNLKVKLIPGTRLLEVQFTSSSATVAANVANLLVQALSEYTYQTKFHASEQVTQWLEGQLSGLRKEAEDLQQRVVVSQKRAGLFGITGGVDQQGRSSVYSPDLDKLEQSNAQLAQVQSNRILKGAIYETVRSGNAELISQLSGTSLISSASAGVNTTLSLIQAMRGEEARLQAEIAKDATVYDSQYPKLIAEKEALRQVEDSLKAEVDRVAVRAKNDYDIAVRTEDDARRESEKVRAAAEKISDKTIEYSLLKKEADSSQELYQDLLHKLREAGIIESLHSSNITVVDPAHAPAMPSSPVLKIYLLCGLAAGFVFGTSAALIRDRLGDTVVGLDDIEALGLPVMGILPRMPAEVAGAERLSLHMVHSPKSSFAEAVRHLRSSLLLSKSRRPPKVILLTSGSPQEGKSTVAVDLATSFAQMGRRTLLVETDLRRPILTTRLRLGQAEGLSELLSNVEARVQPSTFPEQPGLWVIAGGTRPPFPAELLGSDRMKELMDRWRGEFEMIVLDCAPLLPVADVLMFAAVADAIVLVVRSDVTSRSSITRCRQLLAPILAKGPAKIFGVAVNALSKETVSYYGYYGKSTYDYEAAEDHVEV